ncbi:MAG: DUF1146 domain-containing protein [Bacilli bacterium]|nr:DUF1146 domain-containing protein [Bacilli bacterium]
MSLKVLLYCVVVPLTLWALDSVQINQIFKKNRYYASRLFYLLVSVALSYLVVNFFFDFFSASTIIQ